MDKVRPTLCWLKGDNQGDHDFLVKVCLIGYQPFFQNTVFDIRNTENSRALISGPQTESPVCCLIYIKNSEMLDLVPIYKPAFQTNLLLCGLLSLGSRDNILR